MSEALIIALIQLTIKYGPDVALAFAKLVKGGATIDDAIAALELAKTKTAQDYLNEAKAALPVPTPVPTPATPPAPA